MINVIGLDHIYIAVSQMERSIAFYDVALGEVLGFKRNEFVLGEDHHVQYFNRHFGYVLRPARRLQPHDPYAVGLHHLCLRVASVKEVQQVAAQLCHHGIEATPAKPHQEYAPDYWATFFCDPDGLRLEVTNYREERRHRHDHWEQIP